MVTYRGQTIHTRRHGSLRLRLRHILEQRNITRYGFAKYSGLSLNTIYRLTRPHGRFELIQADTLERLCGALRVTPAELFEYEQPAVGKKRGGMALRGKTQRRTHLLS